jgi:hypothetical protein
MQMIMISCPAADRLVPIVREPTGTRPKPSARCLAPCTGRLCPAHLKAPVR